MWQNRDVPKPLNAPFASIGSPVWPPRSDTLGTNPMSDQLQPDSNPAPDAILQTWKLTLAYDGTDFQGWQVQPGLPTIQGELQAALGRVTGESPLPQGSGRTDAGVHALAQVASFALRAPIPPGNLLRAVNRTLPPSIRISEARTMQNTFHARHSATAKTYEYRILRATDSPPFLCPPFLARYVYACTWPLALDTLQACARLFEGEHDFLSFAATDPDLSHREFDPAETQFQNAKPLTVPPESTIRTIFSSAWEQRPSEHGELLVYRIRGNGFLHHMVRNLVGTMIEVARGQLALAEIPRILAARSRSEAGPTAPARGLFLQSVDYPPES
jgi:tRNA pseudouridine38-40 synthase